MPTICIFNGIVILMHLTNKEHNPPHIHAMYGEFEASFYIENGEIYNGLFQNREKEYVKKFILRYSSELLNMWNTGVYKKLKPID